MHQNQRSNENIYEQNTCHEFTLSSAAVILRLFKQMYVNFEQTCAENCSFQKVSSKFFR